MRFLRSEASITPLLIIVFLGALVVLEFSLLRIRRRPSMRSARIVALGCCVALLFVPDENPALFVGSCVLAFAVACLAMLRLT